MAVACPGGARICSAGKTLARRTTLPSVYKPPALVSRWSLHGSRVRLHLLFHQFTVPFCLYGSEERGKLSLSFVAEQLLIIMKKSLKLPHGRNSSRGGGQLAKHRNNAKHSKEWKSKESTQRNGLKSSQVYPLTQCTSPRLHKKRVLRLEEMLFALQFVLPPPKPVRGRSDTRPHSK